MFLTATHLHLGLNPGSDDVGLGGELAPQPLVGLLPGDLLLEHLVPEGNQVLHLQESTAESQGGEGVGGLPRSGGRAGAKTPQPPFLGSTHGVPLGADVLRGEVGVRVDSGQLDAVGLGDLQDLAVDAHGGHALLVGLRQSGLELVVSGDQALKRRSYTFWSISFFKMHQK